MSSFFSRGSNSLTRSLIDLLAAGCPCCGPLPNHWAHHANHYHRRRSDPEWVQASRDLTNLIQRDAQENLPKSLRTQDIVEQHLRGLSEPERVFNLFFSDEAVRMWKKLFLSLSLFPYCLRYETIFTHQKPSVQFPVNGKRGCELGDVLVLIRDDVEERMSAMFWQAKMIEEWPPKTDTKQWELYTRWPEFEYGPKHGLRRRRDLRFPGPVGCAKYLLLDQPTRRVWSTVAMATSAVADIDEQISALFEGLDARPVSWTREAAKSDWDELIHDLIEYTAEAPLPSKQIGGVEGQRGTWANRLAALSDGDTDHSQLAREDFSDWGIPIIRIVGSVSDNDHGDLPH